MSYKDALSKEKPQTIAAIVPLHSSAMGLGLDGLIGLLGWRVRSEKKHGELTSRCSSFQSAWGDERARMRVWLLCVRLRAV
ncbi:MAG: hypothetical protein D6690_17120 [Nitrospirae bacterium]|nr:MAG: hypothetical protein D6690_17120 [Nitrospirota bacterium]